jgi:hypothetical protein
MADNRRGPSRTPRSSRPPSDGPTPRLRDEDVTKNEALRGLVVRGGAESMAALWED